MTLVLMHDTVCEPTTGLRKNTQLIKNPKTWHAHTHASRQLVRTPAADTIPYLPLKMGIKQGKQIAHAYIYDQLLKNYHEA